MTTVGYGDVFAVSPFGRIISLVNALWGAFLISLLMGSISQIFHLTDNQKKAVVEISNSKCAAASIKSSVVYFNALMDFKKNNAIPIEERTEYVYTKEDLREFKDQMIAEVDKLRVERNDNMDITSSKKTENDIEIVKDQVLELNDKFDYLVYLFLKSQRIKKEESKQGEFYIST